MTEAAAQLDALYAALPALACQGLCGHSCHTRIKASELEHSRARARGVDLEAPTASGHCPALSTALVAGGSCRIHSDRPMVCRLWGVAASMPCPHGCQPAGGHLGDAQALRLLVKSLGQGDPVMLALLEKVAADPQAGPLLAALMRGQKGVKPALAHRMAQLRDAGPH